MDKVSRCVVSVSRSIGQQLRTEDWIILARHSDNSIGEEAFNKLQRTMN